MATGITPSYEEGTMTKAPAKMSTIQTRNLTRRKRWASGQWLAALIFLLPAVIALVVLRLQPTIEAIGLAFTPTAGQGILGTFSYLLSDPDFIGALVLTLVFSAVINPLQIALAMGLAVVMSRRVPLIGLWRTLILLPIAVPQAVSAVIWGVILRPDGPLNGILARFGIPSVPWLTSSVMAPISIIIVLSWVGVGYWMTFLVAGIKDVSPSLHEAAQLDGANGWQAFMNVTLPGVRRILLFVLVADTVSNFLIFAPVQILTAGGPSGSTNLLMYQIYKTAYVNGDIATASAGTLILVLVVVCVVGIQFRMLPGRE